VCLQIYTIRVISLITESVYVLATGEANVRPEATERRSAVRRLWEGWKRVGRRIGDFQARALLTLFYFVILGPFALVIRLAFDPLALAPGAPKGWQPLKITAGAPLDRARRQS
jgi:hypothetical protein